MPDINIELIPAGYMETNCYVVWEDKSADAIIIDPGGSSDAIIGFIAENKLHPIMIVNTHSHADHIGANLILKNEYNCPILIHSAEAAHLTDANLNLSAFIGFTEPISAPPERLLNDGDTIQLGNSSFKVIHTPGHTPGGICLYNGSILFSGDTLFAGSIGRTDFPGGSFEQLIESIKVKLMALPDEVKVYPGHGPSTTIGIERTDNPFI